MANKIIYKFKSGKPIKLLYFAKVYLKFLIPFCLYRVRAKRILSSIKKRGDYDYILQRVAYYNKINDAWTIAKDDKVTRDKHSLFFRGRLSDYKKKFISSVYFFDQHKVTKWFPQSLRWNYSPGDVYKNFDEPTVVKSRLLDKDNINSVLLKLDELRHFIFLRDNLRFEEKQDKVIFRGKIRSSRLRTSFMSKFFGNKMVDCGVVGREEGVEESWFVPKKTIRQHLNYKFIMALEGNDVASNLKWVMSSNSIAVMTRPTCETWFMEGKLKAGVHYIEVKDDFSDLEEKIEYYLTHSDEAEQIIANAHKFIDQFKDKKREKLIGIMVLQKYFGTSGQL